MLKTFVFRWVTQITTNPKYPEMILSASRDKSLIVWKLTRDDSGESYQTRPFPVNYSTFARKVGHFKTFSNFCWFCIELSHFQKIDYLTRIFISNFVYPENFPGVKIWARSVQPFLRVSVTTENYAGKGSIIIYFNRPNIPHFSAKLMNSWNVIINFFRAKFYFDQ